MSFYKFFLINQILLHFQKMTPFEKQITAQPQVNTLSHSIATFWPLNCLSKKNISGNLIKKVQLEILIDFQSPKRAMPADRLSVEFAHNRNSFHNSYDRKKKYKKTKRHENKKSPRIPIKLATLWTHLC